MRFGLLAVVLLAVGCGGSEESELAGEWTGTWTARNSSGSASVGGTDLRLSIDESGEAAAFEGEQAWRLDGRLDGDTLTLTCRPDQIACLGFTDSTFTASGPVEIVGSQMSATLAVSKGGAPWGTLTLLLSE